MIYVFTGDNTFQRDEEVDSFVSSFASVHGDLSVEKISGENISVESLGDIMQSQPFLTDRRLIKIRSLSNNKMVLEKFIDKADSLSDSTDILIVEDRLDNRSKTTSLLKKLSDFRDFSSLEGSDLSDWLANLFSDNKCSISKNDIDYLIDRVGANQAILRSEAQKLILHGQIDRKLINVMTDELPHSSVFNLLDKLVAGETKSALELYSDQRRQNIEPQAILGMIAWQLVNISTIAMASTNNVQVIATESSLSPFVVRKNLPIAKKLSKSRLARMFDLTIETDLNLKTLSLNADNALRQLIIELSLA